MPSLSLNQRETQHKAAKPVSNTSHSERRPCCSSEKNIHLPLKFAFFLLVAHNPSRRLLLRSKYMPRACLALECQREKCHVHHASVGAAWPGDSEGVTCVAGIESGCPARASVTASSTVKQGSTVMSAFAWLVAVGLSLAKTFRVFVNDS